MLTELMPDDAALAELLGATHQRFQRLIAEAEKKARPFYAKLLGREASISQVIDEVFRQNEMGKILNRNKKLTERVIGILSAKGNAKSIAEIMAGRLTKLWMK